MSLEPGRHVVNVPVELAVHAAVPFVLGDERSASPAVRLRHELANLRVAILDVTIGINDFGVLHNRSFRRFCLRLRFAQHAPDQFNLTWSPVITARLIGSIVLPDLRPLPKLTPGNADQLSVATRFWANFPEVGTMLIRRPLLILGVP